jgi:hypothetical protein
MRCPTCGFQDAKPPLCVVCEKPFKLDLIVIGGRAFDDRGNEWRYVPTYQVWASSEAKMWVHAEDTNVYGETSYEQDA